jgi:hypothetical protein
MTFGRRHVQRCKEVVGDGQRIKLHQLAAVRQRVLAGPARHLVRCERGEGDLFHFRQVQQAAFQGVVHGGIVGDFLRRANADRPLIAPAEAGRHLVQLVVADGEGGDREHDQEGQQDFQAQHHVARLALPDQL